MKRLATALLALLGGPAAAQTSFGLGELRAQQGERVLRFEITGRGRATALEGTLPGWAYELVNDANCTLTLRARAVVGAAAVEWPAERERLARVLRVEPCEGEPALRGRATLDRPGPQEQPARRVSFTPSRRDQ